jgi:hypothetical protein
MSLDRELRDVFGGRSTLEIRGLLLVKWYKLPEVSEENKCHFNLMSRDALHVLLYRHLAAI